MARTTPRLLKQLRQAIYSFKAMDYLRKPGEPASLGANNSISSKQQGLRRRVFAVLLSSSLLLTVALTGSIVAYNLAARSNPKPQYLIKGGSSSNNPCQAPGGGSCSNENTSPKSSVSSGHSTSRSSSSQASPSPSGTSGISSNNPTINPPHVWIMSKTAFQSIITDATASSRLQKDTIYLIGGQTMPGYNIVPTETFDSEAGLVNAVNSHSLPAYVKALLYDDEDWSGTPKNEQQDPKTYINMAAQTTHSAGLQFISTPALDLTNVLNPGTSGNDADTAAYISDGIAGWAGQAGADILDIQSQRLIQDSSLFISFIEQASAQARSFDAHITVLAGLSTCAGSPNAQQLSSGAINSNNYVSGWWMNVPGSSNAPGCTPNPSLAIQAIDSLPPSWY